MEMTDTFVNRRPAAPAFAAALLLLIPGVVRGQSSASSAGSVTDIRPAAAHVETDEYRVGPGDILSISVTDAPEMGGKFRVSEAGSLEMGILAAPIQAEGKTPAEISRSVRQALIDSNQLRNPTVNTFIDEYHGRTVTVLGAVNKPSVYPLERRTNVLDAIAMAGGLLPNAGSSVTVVRGPASAEASGTTVGSVAIVDLARLEKGRDSTANIEVRKGDVINVNSAEVVYVVGAVTKPGGFVMPDPSSGMSVVQALAMAEGFTSLAATHRGLIIRQSTSEASRSMIPVDISQFLAGKEADVRLAPNDILFVPESGAKRSLKVAGDVAIALVNGIATYGVGYRLGTIQ
jgi:polysaccharide export outer membrane protein